MSKTGKAKRGRGAGAGGDAVRPTPRPARAATADDAEPTPQPAKPFKPRRKLFFALLGALVLWVIVLLVMYFTTVYPRRGAEQREGHPVPADVGDKLQ